jgi:hypothetical protein
MSAMSVLARIAGPGADKGGSLFLPAAVAVGFLVAARWLYGAGSHRSSYLWVGGLGALAVAAAALGSPQAVVALSTALVACGGLMFIPGADRAGYRWLYILAAVAASGLPFTPSWALAPVIEGKIWPWGGILALAYSALIAGFLAGTTEAEAGEQPVVPGVRSIYIGGLILLLVGFVLAGWGPMLTTGGTFDSWWGGGLVALLGLLWLQARKASFARVHNLYEANLWEAPTAWLRRYTRRGTTAGAFSLHLLARLLEGEAAMLWALVLLSLIVSLFVQLGIGT